MIVKSAKRALLLVVYLPGVVFLSACNTQPDSNTPSLETQNSVEDSIEYRAGGKDIKVDVAKQQDIKQQIINLLESCAYRSKKRVLENDWLLLSASDDALELRLAEPLQITAASGAQLTIDGIIYSVKEPLTDKTLIVARHGNTYFSPFFGCDTGIFDTLSTMLATAG